MVNEHVLVASRALVHPTTDHHIRAQASKFLEEWNVTPVAWDDYIWWMDTFEPNDVSYEGIGMQLLCLQLLQKKIRSEVPRGTGLNSCLLAIQRHLAILGASTNSSISSPAAICTAALVVRCRAIDDLFRSINNGDKLSILRVLSQLPVEMEACREVGASNAAKELEIYVDTIISVLIADLGNADESIRQITAQILLSWTTVCRLSISRLRPVLGVVLSLLSASTSSSLQCNAAKSLTESLSVVTDSCTETRETSCHLILDNFASLCELACSVEDDDVAHAVATLCCTLVTEEVDTIVSHPSSTGNVLPSLLRFQTHRLYRIRTIVLECWLTIQEVPMNDRHVDWRKPFGISVVQCIIPSIAYPAGFNGWENSEVDQTAWEEYRSLVPDVLISLYSLLRVEYVEGLVRLLQQDNDWITHEVALLGLVAGAREVNTRCQSRISGFAEDRSRTVHLLLQGISIVTQKVDPNLHTQKMKARFVGAYAPTWAAHCQPSEVSHILQYLQSLLAVGLQEAAHAFQSLAAQISVSSENEELILTRLNGVWQAVLSTVPLVVSVVDPVTVGCVRILCETSRATQYLHDLAAPLVQEKGRSALGVLTAVSQGRLVDEEILHAAIDELSCCLHVLRTLVRFSDSSKNHSESPPVALLLDQQIGPFLSSLNSADLEKYEPILDEMLSIHEQLLRTAPDLMGPHLQGTLGWAFSIFTRHQQPRALEIVSSAVETYGNRQAELFRSLIPNVIRHVQDTMTPENVSLAATFFQLCHRLLLFFPPVPPETTMMAIEYLDGQMRHSPDRESSRTCLQFLAAVASGRNSNDPFDAVLLGRLADICWRLLMLEGGKMLLLPASECLYMVLKASPAPSLPVNHGSQVLALLPTLPKGKGKMLLQDYARVVTGDLPESFLADNYGYTL